MFAKFTRKKYLLETGFSMLEAVVVVGVLLALAVGGFLAYGAIAQNAKKAKIETAASVMHTAVMVAGSDGNPTTNPQDVIDDWNSTSSEIRVAILEPMNTTSDTCVGALWVEDMTISARRGHCTETITEGSDPAPVAFFMMMQLDVDLDNDGIRDNDGIPFHVNLVNVTSGETVGDQAGESNGQWGISDFVMLPVAETPIYELTVTADGKTYSLTTTAADWTGGPDSWNLDLSYLLTPDGFTESVL